MAAIEFERSHGRTLQEVDEEREQELQEKWRDSIHALPSRRTRDELISLCVYEKTPRFMRPVIPAQKDILQAKYIKKGLAKLAESYGLLDRKRRVS